MTKQASFALRGGRNPDVLTCIANLSNDEVFTPPEFANRMLDNMATVWAAANNGESIWSNPDVTFLDPFTKSGVFLREITARLTKGLEEAIPDLDKRVDHILTKQVFGMGITDLTAKLARRSLYCSKWANGPHSIASSFETEEGNIWFERTEHSWAGGTEWVYTADETGKQVKKFTNGKCEHCGANQKSFDRGAALESHAYAFIHTDNIKALIAELFGANMQFDVIIGNPPYQLSDGGGEGASAIPLYHQFVLQAKKLEPRQLVMVVPARWYSGGKGLDDFRDDMLTDGKLVSLHDFPETDLVFPGVNIRGGVCFFQWAEDHSGPTQVVNYKKEGETSTASRPLLEPGLSTFVRYNAAISILQKVRSHGEENFGDRVQSRNPFGIPSNFSAFSTELTTGSPVLLYRSRRGSSADKQVYVSNKSIANNLAFKDKIKVLVSKASPGGDEYPHSVFSEPLVAPKNSVCTETYLIVDFVSTIEEGERLIAYMKTRFFRFMVSLIKTTQNISKGSFAFVPVQDLSRDWTDEALYEKYGITADEVAFIESMIRPMQAVEESE